MKNLRSTQKVPARIALQGSFKNLTINLAECGFGLVGVGDPWLRLVKKADKLEGVERAQVLVLARLPPACPPLALNEVMADY